MCLALELCIVHIFAHLAPASHLADFALQPAQLRLPTCTPCGSPTCHTYVKDYGASNTIILDTALHILIFLLCMQILIADAAECRA